MKIQNFINQSLTFQILDSALTIQQQVNAKLAQYKLNFLQSLILVSLFFEDKKSCRPTELHKTFKRTKGNISHCLAYLEEKKLIQRQTEARDKRSYVITLSKKGEDICSHLIKYFDQVQTKTEIELGEKKYLDFLELLQRIEKSHS